MSESIPRMRCPGLRIRATFALTVAGAFLHGAAALEWQDCGLLSDHPSLQLLSYTHEPDPIVLGGPYRISRKFRSLLDTPIHNLTEDFRGYIRDEQGEWNLTFSNGPFSRCGSQDYQTPCPLAAHSEFEFAEHHPTTHVGEPGEHRAVEHYYADGRFAGCAVVVYKYEAPQKAAAAVLL